jgi:hypothetical protein
MQISFETIARGIPLRNCRRYFFLAVPDKKRSGIPPFAVPFRSLWGCLLRPGALNWPCSSSDCLRRLCLAKQAMTARPCPTSRLTNFILSVAIAAFCSCRAGSPFGLIGSPFGQVIPLSMDSLSPVPLWPDKQFMGDNAASVPGSPFTLPLPHYAVGKQGKTGENSDFSPQIEKAPNSLRVRCLKVVARAGVEPATQGFSVLCSTN